VPWSGSGEVAGEAMLWLSNNLGLSDRFPNRVELWKRRCHNPMRRACRRGGLIAIQHGNFGEKPPQVGVKSKH
jgi:hypothetical protein